MRTMSVPPLRPALAALLVAVALAGCAASTAPTPIPTEDPAATRRPAPTRSPSPEPAVVEEGRTGRIPIPGADVALTLPDDWVTGDAGLTAPAVGALSPVLVAGADGGSGGALAVYVAGDEALAPFAERLLLSARRAPGLVGVPVFEARPIGEHEAAHISLTLEAPQAATGVVDVHQYVVALPRAGVLLLSATVPPADAAVVGDLEAMVASLGPREGSAG